LIGVKVASRFIGEQQFGFGDDRAPRLRRAAAARRKAGWEQILFGNDIEAIQGVSNDRLALGFADVAI